MALSYRKLADLCLEVYSKVSCPVSKEKMGNKRHSHSLFSFTSRCAKHNRYDFYVSVRESVRERESESSESLAQRERPSPRVLK